MPDEFLHRPLTTIPRDLEQADRDHTRVAVAGLPMASARRQVLAFEENSVEEASLRTGRRNCFEGQPSSRHPRLQRRSAMKANHDRVWLENAGKRQTAVDRHLTDDLRPVRRIEAPVERAGLTGAVVAWRFS